MQTARTHQNAFARVATRITLFVLPALLVSGCRSMSHTDGGVLTGAALGGVAGNLIGKGSGLSRTAGTAIGATLGAVAGGLHGNALDKLEAKTDHQLASATGPVPVRQGPLPLEEVIGMSQDGVTDTTIINQIRTSGSRYQLTGQDVRYLTRQGVSQRVIQEMQSTAIAHAPRARARPAVVYQPVVPVYAPRRHISVGFGYGPSCRPRRHCR